MRWKHIIRGLTFSSIIFGSFFIPRTNANEDILTEEEEYRARCSGMFSKGAIPGGVDPYISITFKTPLPPTGVEVAVIWYEYYDMDKIGYSPDNSTDRWKSYCDEVAVEEEYCPESELGKFIFPENDPGSIVSKVFNFSDKDINPSYNYEVKKTGYYCVVTRTATGRFTAILDWRNPYGELPATDYPKLPFYGLLSLVYIGIGIVWMALSIAHWREILPVQNYISGVIFFLMVEIAFNWGYWENYNAYGKSSTFLLCVVAVLNAGRNSISFFMLLIVCMGYGVVKPTLGSVMLKCQLLAGVHFIFGVIYAAGTMTLNPETSGPLVFMIIFPLALTMTTFHIWTLQSLTHTIQTLEIRKQSVKALMYRRLYMLLMFSVSVLGIFFIINMANYVHREDPDYIPKYWRWRWFLLDGWLNILYLIVFTVIVVLWRPTKNNKRFAMSEELGQDDELDDLEINDIRAAENLGYDNVKYRDRPNGNNNSQRIFDDDDTAIFDIGDEGDDDKWTDNEQQSEVDKYEDTQTQQNPQYEHGVDSPRPSEDIERLHLQQEMNKLN